MSKRKKSSSWKHFIKILEKPNRLDRSLYNNSKKHESVQIRKLAVEAVKNLRERSTAFASWYNTYISGILSSVGPSTALVPQPIESLAFLAQLFVNFWQNVDDQRKRENIGKDLFFMHFEGFTELEDDVKSESDESELEEEYYAHIIDLDNVTEQRRPPFCFAKEWSIKKIRESFDSYEEVTTDEDKYARRIIDHYIFCLENRPEYFAKRPQTEATFRVRFIEPIIEPFIFIFKDLIDMTWGEITSLSSANRRNHRLAKGTGSKQMVLVHLHPEGDKCKLDRCLVDVLNNLFYDYNVCEFELAKKLKVFGLQTKGYNCIISELYIFGRGIYCIRKLSQFPLPTRISDLCYLYELLRAMFLLRDELIKSLRVIQDLKIAKARKLEVIKPFSSYILRIPPS
ncbi:7842_t:CDS:10 [Rhizophagus irregularis]|nr:7842_t:CDS:10 [Rhizophagus irregularis]